MAGRNATAAPDDSDTIRFMLDGEQVCVQNPDPTRTVLQYLREDLGRTGTKEGCAEGDCGACTVVLAELNRDGDDLNVIAINSCIQFLPTLDGKELITVESLSPDSNELHPVQQALVDCHGSQCGFCTPGFVMSLFALYKSDRCADGKQPSRRSIDDTLAGNLCRCTGYRPIIAAAGQMCTTPAEKEGWLYEPGHNPNEAAARVSQLQGLRRSKALRCESERGLFIAGAKPKNLTQPGHSVTILRLLQPWNF